MRKLRRAHQKQARKAKKLKQQALAAGTAAVIAFGAGMAANHARAAYSHDHVLPVAQDADADLLTNAEELAIGYLPFDPDQNGNQIPDGVDLAKSCAAITNQLTFGPHPTDPDKPYIEHAGQFGLETCDICGQTVNMGPASIVNPKLGLTVECPLIAMHYMDHGSFSYAGDVHNGRLDVPALLRALDVPVPGEPPNHQLPVDNDADGDLLANTEELAIGYLPFDPDQNRNQTPDGVELAKRCAAVINELPEWDHQAAPRPTETYKIDRSCRGTELCEICGEEVNMCHMEIVNPQLGLSTDVYFIALHYMEHGSFNYDGTENDGRLNVPLLMRVLQLRHPHEPDDHQLPVDNDTDGDLLSDREELAADYDLCDPDQDDDLSPDGIEFAKQCAAIVHQLPEANEAEPGEIYKGFATQWGLEACDICGKIVNMGGAWITNPKLGLTVDFPILALHYIEHGSLGYAGSVHRGRLDVPLLLRVLEMPRRCGHLGTMYLPGDLNKDCKVDFKDFAQVADEWLQNTSPNHGDSGGPRMTYTVDDCDPDAPLLSTAEDQTRFTATVRDNSVHFEDMMRANCCPVKIELRMSMSVQGNLITIREMEYGEGACDCECDFPVTAAIGGLQPGTYTLEVYEEREIINGQPSWVRHIGTTTVAIGGTG